MGGLQQVNGNVALTLEKLPGIRGGHFTKYWGGGASARGLVRFICLCHDRGVRGHAPTGKF